MADFGELQKKFDNDPALSRRFLLDPVGVLAEHGVVLAPQQAFELQQDVMNFTKPSATPGASPAISIHITAPHISIGIKPPHVSVTGNIDIRP